MWISSNEFLFVRHFPPVRQRRLIYIHDNFRIYRKVKGGIDSALGRWGASEEGIPLGWRFVIFSASRTRRRNVFAGRQRPVLPNFIETSNGAHLHSAFSRV